MNLINGLKNDPNSRRHIISSWNPPELKEMSLPACHVFSQFFVAKNKLSCQLYQRSCDMFLGVPFNIASYSLFTHMLARECNLEVGNFIHSLGDFHIYDNHIEQVKEQISRKPYSFPTLKIKRSVNNINDFKLNDFEIENYNCHSQIKAEMVA